MTNAAHHMTEEEILLEYEEVKVAMSDPERFGVLYDRYFRDIFLFVFRRTDNEMITGDIVSQTFYNALKKLKSYKFMGLPFSAWLFRIATNEINKHYRKSQKRRVFSLEEQKVKEIFEEGGEEGNEDQIKLVIEKLNSLPTDLIEILELRFFESKSFKEIAFILEISESSAKMRVYRTLEKLKKEVTKKIIT